MGNDRDATNPDQWKAAIDSYADRFTALGLQPPRTSVVRGQGHAELWRLLHDRVGGSSPRLPTARWRRRSGPCGPAAATAATTRSTSGRPR